MPSESPGDITLMLERISAGGRSAEQDLLPRVYIELHRLAHAQLRGERPGHTLQATGLVNEVYVRLCGAGQLGCNNRGHFFAIAARMMRRVLIDYARQRQAGKRGSGACVTPLIEDLLVSEENLDIVLDLNEALGKLAVFSPRQAQVVEMRFFAGMKEEEIASVLGLSTRSIKRDWFVARAWLHKQLSAE